MCSVWPFGVPGNFIKTTVNVDGPVWRRPYQASFVTALSIIYRNQWRVRRQFQYWLRYLAKYRLDKSAIPQDFFHCLNEWRSGKKDTQKSKLTLKTASYIFAQKLGHSTELSWLVGNTTFDYSLNKWEWIIVCRSVKCLLAIRLNKLTKPKNSKIFLKFTRLPRGHIPEGWANSVKITNDVIIKSFKFFTGWCSLVDTWREIVSLRSALFHALSNSLCHLIKLHAKKQWKKILDDPLACVQLEKPIWYVLLACNFEVPNPREMITVRQQWDGLL